MRYKNLRYSCNVIGFAVLMFLAIKELVSLLLMAFSVERGTAPYLLINIAAFIVSCIMPVITMENMLGLHPKLFRRTNTAVTAACGVYSYLIILIAGFINSLFLAALRLAGLDFAPRTIAIPDGAVSVVLYFIHICVLPPLLEEIFVRGYILNALKPVGTTFAVIVSSAVFSLMHSSLENFFLYFVCGIILAKVYLTFDSIFPGMLVHFINNTMSFFILYFQQRVNAVSALSMIAYINIFILILGFVGKKHLDKCGFKFKKVLGRDKAMGEKLGCIFKSPVAVTALAMLVFFAAYQSFHSLV